MEVEDALEKSVNDEVDTGSKTKKLSSKKRRKIAMESLEKTKRVNGATQMLENKLETAQSPARLSSSSSSDLLIGEDDRETSLIDESRDGSVEKSRSKKRRKAEKESRGVANNILQVPRENLGNSKFKSSDEDQLSLTEFNTSSRETVEVENRRSADKDYGASKSGSKKRRKVAKNSPGGNGTTASDVSIDNMSAATPCGESDEDLFLDANSTVGGNNATLYNTPSGEIFVTPKAGHSSATTDQQQSVENEPLRERRVSASKLAKCDTPVKSSSKKVACPSSPKFEATVSLCDMPSRDCLELNKSAKAEILSTPVTVTPHKDLRTPTRHSSKTPEGVIVKPCEIVIPVLSLFSPPSISPSSVRKESLTSPFLASKRLMVSSPRQELMSSPVKTGSVKASSVKTGSVASSPVKTGSVDTTPVKTGSVNTSPVKPGFVKASPVKTSSVNTTPVQTGSVKPNPVKIDQVKTVPVSFIQLVATASVSSDDSSSHSYDDVVAEYLDARKKSKKQEVDNDEDSQASVNKRKRSQSLTPRARMSSSGAGVSARTAMRLRSKDPNAAAEDVSDVACEQTEETPRTKSLVSKRSPSSGISNALSTFTLVCYWHFVLSLFSFVLSRFSFVLSLFSFVLSIFFFVLSLFFSLSLETNTYLQTHTNGQQKATLMRRGPLD